MYTLNISAKFELRSFTHSWDNRGYCKNLGSPCVRPRTLFSQIFNWLLFAWKIQDCVLLVRNLGEKAFERVRHFIGRDFMASSVWRHMDPWRHRSRDHSKQHMWLRWSIETKPVSRLVFEILSFKYFITLWCHHWRHEAWIDYPCGSFGRTMQ